jgi:hypothetical protein
MIERVIRFLNRPVRIVRTPPSRRVLVAFWCLVALVWPLVHVADFLTTVILVEGSVPGYHEGDPGAAWALASGGVVRLAIQKALWIVVGAAWAMWAFRSWPRVTLAILAVLCALVAAAVLWNTRLLIPLIPLMLHWGWRAFPSRDAMMPWPRGRPQCSCVSQANMV